MPFDKHPGPWRAQDYSPTAESGRVDIDDLSTCEMGLGDVIVDRVVDANGEEVIGWSDGSGVVFADKDIAAAFIALGVK